MITNGDLALVKNNSIYENGAIGAVIIKREEKTLNT